MGKNNSVYGARNCKFKHKKTKIDAGLPWWTLINMGAGLPWRGSLNNWRFVWCNCYDSRIGIIVIRMCIDNSYSLRIWEFAAGGIWRWEYAILFRSEYGDTVYIFLSSPYSGWQNSTWGFLSIWRWTVGLNVPAPQAPEEPGVVAVFAREKDQNANNKACDYGRNNHSSAVFGHYEL